jgi:hypothetical protein
MAPVEVTGELFPGARQAFRLRRDVGEIDGPWTSKEIVYGITSLPTDLAGPRKIVSTGSATSPSARTIPRSGPVPHPESWPASAAWSSAPCAWQTAPTSPMPAVTCSITMLPSLSTTADQHAGTRQIE